MADREYWRERFQQLENAMHSKSINICQYIIRQYQMAMRNMDKELAFWYQKFAEINGISFQEAKKTLMANELPEFHASVAEYIAIAQRENLSDEWKRKLENASNRVKISRMETLQLALQSAIEKLFKKQADTLNTELPSVYDSSYYHTAFEIQKGFGIGATFQGVDDNKLKTVLSRPWLADEKTFSDRIWDNKNKLVNTLNLEMTQAVIRGDDYRRAASKVASRMKASQGAAMRLVMTESAFIASHAQHDCFKNLDVEQYEFIATLDRHTSTICRSMDRKHFKMSDFKPGTTAPPMHPNCRSCTAPYFGDEEDIGRAARGLDDGKTFHVSGDMQYNEWKDKISAQNDLISKAKNDKIKEKILWEQMEKNLAPPTDEYLKSRALALRDDLHYTIGKKGADRFYYDNSDVPIWPPNDGGIGKPTVITLKAGTILLDRYGGEQGQFLAEKGTSFTERALPRCANISNSNYHVYRVKKDLQGIERSIIAPWFGEKGLGIQYRTPKPIKELKGYLEEVFDYDD